jgi:uncharacterized protein (DUF608 family)
MDGYGEIYEFTITGQSTQPEIETFYEWIKNAWDALHPCWLKRALRSVVYLMSSMTWRITSYGTVILTM